MLLTEFHGQATAVVEASPAATFTAITAIDHLSDWNERIASVIDAPDAALGEGVEWVVQIAVPPAKWRSRSTVVRYDPDRLLFDYRTQTDDGNPSFAVWRWSVKPDSAGAKVTVDWEVHPKTFWRRLLFAKLRRKQLANEVPDSLHALAYHLAPSEVGRVQKGAG